MKKKRMMEEILSNQEYIKRNLDFMYKMLQPKLLEIKAIIAKISLKVERI